MKELGKMEPGRLYEIGGKVFSVCAKCKQIVRMDKPILGSLHICE
jgi:hypothetical protein